MHILSHFFAHYILKSLGVVVLYFAGRIAFFFNPARVSYSYMELWNKDFDKGDAYWRGAEEFSQKAIGFAVLMLIFYLLSPL